MKSTQRYYPPQKFMDAYAKLSNVPPLDIIGYSVKHRPIYATTIGKGKHKILAWSQMHGNETTTTRALVELVHLLSEPQKQGESEQFCLRVIFQLNPDGAQRFTRLNANDVDLNRDAKAQTQPETKALMHEFHKFQPNYCLNLHGQRTIYAAGTTSLPASLSFLAPSATSDRSITPARKIAMQLIASIVNAHKQEDHWGIGRYDDVFNINCTGDYFTSLNIPTLLFEAGHYPKDYHRDSTVALILKSLEVVIKSIVSQEFTNISVNAYHQIPANQTTLCDLEFTNVTIVNNGKITKSSLFVQFQEILHEDHIHFVPQLLEDHPNLSGLRIIDLAVKTQQKPILINKSILNIIDQLKSLIDF